MEAESDQPWAEQFGGWDNADDMRDGEGDPNR
jgi:hypothetical protein